MDYQLLKRVVAELEQQLFPATVAKIYQPDSDVFVFKLWNGHENLKLLISAQGQQSRVHLTTKEWLNPALPPRFCQLLRARLKRIESVTLKADDRIVTLQGQGDKGPCRLIAELTGKYSNLILVNDDGGIIDVLHRVTLERGGRNLIAGAEYLYPLVRQHQAGADLLVEEPELAQQWYWNRYAEGLIAQDGQQTRQQLHEQLLKSVSRQQHKLEKRLAKILSEAEQQQDPERHKIKGELLLANMYQVKKGMAQIRLQNYYSEQQEWLDIDLDTQLSPHENAERYFKTYKKFRRAVEHHERRIQETQQELDWLADIEYQLTDCSDKEVLEDITDELRKAGLYQEEGQLHGRRTTVANGPRQFTSPSGYNVYVGRNNRQNDEVTTRMLKKGDFWFHSLGVPGAHVVLKSAGGGEVPQRDLDYAAALAAGYCRLRNDAAVDVMMADPVDVEKKRHAPAGQVLVRAYTTLRVAPERGE